MISYRTPTLSLSVIAFGALCAGCSDQDLSTLSGGQTAAQATEDIARRGECDPDPGPPDGDAATVTVRVFADDSYPRDETEPNPDGFALTVNGAPVESIDFPVDLRFGFRAAGPTSLELRQSFEPQELAAQHTFTATPLTFSDIAQYPGFAGLPKYEAIVTGHPGAFRSELLVRDWGPPAHQHWRYTVVNALDEPLTVRAIAEDPDSHVVDPTAYSHTLVEHLPAGGVAVVEVPMPPPGIVASIRWQGDSEPTPSFGFAAYQPGPLAGIPGEPFWVSFGDGTISTLYVKPPGGGAEGSWTFFLCRDEATADQPMCEVTKHRNPGGRAAWPGLLGHTRVVTSPPR